MNDVNDFKFQGDLLQKVIDVIYENGFFVQTIDIDGWEAEQKYYQKLMLHI